MSDEELQNHDLATQQREKGNVLMAAQLFFIKALCIALIPIALAVGGVAIQDHYILRDLAKSDASASSLSVVNNGRIDKLEKLTPAPESRWTEPMMADYSDRLKSGNSYLAVPKVDQIHKSHYWELPH